MPKVLPKLKKKYGGRVSDVKPTDENKLTAEDYFTFISEHTPIKPKSYTDLSSGSTYIALFNQICPGAIKIKADNPVDETLSMQELDEAETNTEYNGKKSDSVKNWRKLQNALHTLKLDISFDIDEMVSGNEKAHELFMHWFKLFYESNTDMKFNERKDNEKKSKHEIEVSPDVLSRPVTSFEEVERARKEYYEAMFREQASFKHYGALEKRDRKKCWCCILPNTARNKVELRKARSDLYKKSKVAKEAKNKLINLELNLPVSAQ